MSDSASWYARKLGAAPPRAPYAPQQPTNYPGTPPPPPHIPPVPPATLPQVTKDNIADAAALWKGGQGTKTETARCPHCGGDHFFSISNAPGSKVATQNGMASAAPRCYDCGYTTRHGMQTGAM